MSSSTTDAPPAGDQASPSTRRERVGWYFYDWANSAFSTTVITVFLGPYLTEIAERAAGCTADDCTCDATSIRSACPSRRARSTRTCSRCRCCCRSGAAGDRRDRRPDSAPPRLLALFAYIGAGGHHRLLLPHRRPLPARRGAVPRRQHRLRREHRRLQLVPAAAGQPRRPGPDLQHRLGHGLPRRRAAAARSTSSRTPSAPEAVHRADRAWSHSSRPACGGRCSPRCRCSC